MVLFLTYYMIRQLVRFLSPLSNTVSEPLTYRGVLLSTLLQVILNTSHHLLNVLLQTANNYNSVALFRERTIPTERPPHVGEVSANFFEQRVSHGQRDESPRPYSRLSRPDRLQINWKLKKKCFTCLHRNVVATQLFSWPHPSCVSKVHSSLLWQSQVA
jgi:hypothetical protein